MYILILKSLPAAGLGGIYGLFIGMSVITFFEVLYFFTCELWTTYNRKMAQQAAAWKKQQVMGMAEAAKVIVVKQFK